jgi:hypothetical protein
VKTLREWNAEELLAIPVDRPEQLFSGDLDAAREQLRQLNSLWHPDRNADVRSSWVFSHLHELFAAARERMESGMWIAANELHLRSRDDVWFEFRFQRRHAFELGEYFVGRDTVVYTMRRDYEELVHNGCQHIAALKFADARMQHELSRCLPHIVQRFETRDLLIVAMRKEEGFVVLRDLLGFVGGPLDPRHVAWIISSLLNWLCYMEWAGVTHNGLSLDSCLVSPQLHAAAVPGGWWYATPRLAPLRALPETCVRVVPPDILQRGLADARIDLELLRSVGLQLLGAKLGAIATTDGVPKPLLQWLNVPSAGSALADYEDWQRVLWASFGERRFIEMALSAADIYSI